MGFAIVANESPLVCSTWSDIFAPHEFIHVKDEGLSSVTVVELYTELAARGYDALITRDKRQLKVPDELQALKKSGLTWIGHKEPQGKGLQIITQLMASYCLALPHIIKLIQENSMPLRMEVKNQPRGASQVLNAWKLSGKDYVRASLPR